MIPTQIRQVLSTIQQYDVPVLLMGGQACVLYGAAEYSRDLDLAVLATETSLPRLALAMGALAATVIAVPRFEGQFLERGHAVHFSVPDPTAAPLRVDIMSRMRGVQPFPVLWDRRTTVVLDADGAQEAIILEIMALEDLVSAKKTQRDKDWPMIRRLVDGSYDGARDDMVTDAAIEFWLAELRSPEFLIECVQRFPDAADRSRRPAVVAALVNGDITQALADEQAMEMALDKSYWLPLRRELEALRHQARHDP